MVAPQTLVTLRERDAPWMPVALLLGRDRGDGHWEGEAPARRCAVGSRPEFLVDFLCGFYYFSTGTGGIP